MAKHLNLIWFGLVATTALLVHSFPGIGAYDERLQALYPRQISFIRERMQGRNAFWVVMGWSGFPLVPTDAICYHDVQFASQ